ncbi:MAG TPA: hypothetical protein PLL30_11585 [Candidatus Krumholzibacteria bacterium]|nr:hypothetical protein [Candidatus Krumholzibacteria bacterium]HPD72407.1 hypothetical protein [Candidatus Krumholzibacteria bacterium]HRY40661.1 hypothetical protein [Candidatus Krumholzibacteria bacterium]
MAVLEQLVFGPRPDGEQGRAVLAVSPGVSRPCADEVVRLCEGWGAVPADGLRRPAFLSFPLAVRVSVLTGPLYAVIRIAEGLKPIYHVLILSRSDYQEFELNPYCLAQEDVFLSAWNPDHELPRREVRPGSLAPLVSPPPGAADAGGVDEAIRQILANHRLLLPLERASSDSDRFLALTIAGLPRALRQELRFASWAPASANRYTLAATFKEMAPFTSWQPYLMTSVLGQLHETCEDYVQQVQRCLRTGDLSGLERLSSSARVDLARARSGSLRPRKKVVTATVDEDTGRKLSPAPVDPIESPRAPAGPAAARSRPATRPRPAPVTAAVQGDASPRWARPSPPRRRTRRPLRFRVALILALGALAAGAGYLWSSGHWSRLPGFAIGDVRLPTDPNLGVVDVAALYQGVLNGIHEGGMADLVNLDGSSRRRGLEILQQAGHLLETQGQGYLRDADRTLEGTTVGGVPLPPVERLHERGQVLARELRRLALAQVSVRESVDWADLPDLEQDALKARYDSLLTRRHQQARLEPALLQVDDLLRGVNARLRQIGGLTALERLLGAARWEPQWNHRCETAIDDLGAAHQSRAHDLRNCAEALLRLKRAEHATSFGERAYAEDYGAATWSTPAVADILPALYAQVRAVRAEELPALLRATADFYTELEQAVAADATVDRQVRLATSLAGNRAVSFDPAVYADHVARVRYLLLERCLAAGMLPDALPEVCFAGGVAQEFLDYHAASAAGLDAVGWRRLAGSLNEPFLARWAVRRARAVESSRHTRESAFAEELAALDQQRAELLRLVAGGGEGAESWLELAAAATRVRDAYAGALSAGSPEAAAWQRVAALTAALREPPILSLSAVTVRIDGAPGRQPPDLIVELRVGDAPPWRSARIELGPAAPAGSGWVGTVNLGWTVRLTTGARLAVRVLAADDGAVVTAAGSDGWLEDWQPHRLGGMDAGNGVRLSWYLTAPYWEALALPSLLP